MIETAANAAPPAPQPEEASRKKRKVRGGLECKLGLLLGLGGLVGSRLGHLWIAFDVFSQFTLQFALVTIAFAIGLFLPRARLFAAFILIILGLAAISMWPQLASRYPMAVTDAPQDSREVKVASFNTWYSNQQVDAVRAEIERLDADVVTLVEVGANKKVALDALRGRYPYQVTCFTIDYCNLAILSKFPILESDAQVGWEGPPYIRARLGAELGNLTVFGVHTIRFPHSRAQFRQVQAMAGLLEATPGRKLVMGDFNATPFSRIIDTVVSRTGLQRLTNLPSWPSRVGLPQVAIDHIFVSPGIVQTQSQQIGEPAGSDHYPVTVRIAVPLKP